jgi:hypothetical protein
VAESTIRAKIKSELEEIDGIGNVHDREGADPGWKPSADPQDPFWEISDAPGIAESYVGIGGDVHVTYTYEIRGYFPYSQDGNSKAHFKRLTELVRDKFRNNTRLDATAQFCGPIQVRALSPDPYALYKDILCHRAIITLPVTERKEAP